MGGGWGVWFWRAWRACDSEGGWVQRTRLHWKEPQLLQPEPSSKLLRCSDLSAVSPFLRCFHPSKALYLLTAHTLTQLTPHLLTPRTHLVAPASHLLASRPHTSPCRSTAHTLTSLAPHVAPLHTAPAHTSTPAHTSHLDVTHNSHLTGRQLTATVLLAALTQAEEDLDVMLGRLGLLKDSDHLGRLGLLNDSHPFLDTGVKDEPHSSCNGGEAVAAMSNGDGRLDQPHSALRHMPPPSATCPPLYSMQVRSVHRSFLKSLSV